MFRRARLSVKPNVRPGIGARGSTAPSLPRGPERPRSPEPAAAPAPQPAAASAPKPAEPTNVPPVDFERGAPQEKVPRSSDEKTDGENDVEESSKSSSTVPQRRKRISSTSSLIKPSVSVPSEPHSLSTVNQEVPQPSPIPTKEKQLCSDRYRIYKAQKLREMLKEELRKEKKQWKNKYAVNESQRPPDRSKMTMRDFIYYLPDNNPMTSSLEQEKKTEKLTPVQAREQEGKSTTDAEDNEEMEEETDDGPLLVPQVKVAEDGSIILDEESLTVEVLRTKGPCVVEENDPIFERGSTTTYSSFRKNYYSKPWSNKETDMFFLAISMVGTDFSMIGQLFPHRARIEIKNKFKREEKTNGWRIDKAFQEKRPFDFDFFAHLLQKVLAEEEKRKQKSVKNHSLKEKKSSKQWKKAKVKKLANKGVNDDPDESVSTNISDTEESQQDVRTVEEKPPSLTLSEQDSEQIALEPDLNQKKRRRENEEETDEQEVENLSGNATVQSDSSIGEEHKNEFQSVRPEVNESEYNKELKLSCLQNIDDGVGLSSIEKVVKITDPVLSSSQQNAMILATESSESSASDLRSSEVETRALSVVNNGESNCTKETNDDLKSKSLETDQTENVKPMVRGRLQRPKPNLSRAVEKKSVLSQDKTDAENKSSHSETSGAKNLPEKDKMNTFDTFGKENTESENTEAEIVSKLSEKICLQEDNQPKAFRPARLMRGRLQRPKPNVGKAAERKEILTSQEPIGADEKRNEKNSCIGKDTSQQMENQSCKTFDCGDITSQSEKKDTSFQNVQPDEPKTLCECLSIQEDNEANTHKPVPILRTQFQKPRPNIGRGTGIKDISSREGVPGEILASGEMEAALGEIASLETSPRGKVPVEANAKEMKADLNEIGRRDISPEEKIPERIDATMEVKTDFKGTGSEISPGEKIAEVIDATEERETDLEETERREISLQEKAQQEVKTIIEMEIDLKETGREISPREKIPYVIDATEERETDVKETGGREISPWEGVIKEVKTAGDMETELEETEREISPWERTPQELKTVGEMETVRQEIGSKISLRKMVLEEVSAIGKREFDLKETGKRDISLMQKVSGKTAIEELEGNSKETEIEISLRKRESEGISGTEEIVADLEKTGNVYILSRENEAEEIGTLRQTETNLMQNSSGDCSPISSLDIKNITSEILSEVHISVGEKRNAEKEVSSQLSHLKNSLRSSELCKTEDQLMQSLDVQEQFSDINLSTSLVQEQKPFEVKPAPFVRSRFKRPKPNLARAALKRETTEAEKCVPGKKLETDKMETVVMQQNSEKTNALPSQDDVASLMISKEKDKSCHRKEAVVLPFIQTEKLSLSKSCEPKEESQSVQSQEKDSVASTGTQCINTSQREMKESVIQTAQPVRGQLLRPRPNIRKNEQGQVAEKSEAKGIIKEERRVLQKDGAKKKFFSVPNCQISSEIEVVSSEVSECRMCENQNPVVLVENLHINRRNALDEKIRDEHKPYIPSPVLMLRRQFQKAKPNLGRAHSKKEEAAIEKDKAHQSEMRKPEDNLILQGDSDTQFLLKIFLLKFKEKTELLESLEVSARKDGISSKETVLAKNDAQSEELGTSGSVGEKILEANSLASVFEEQYLNKQTRITLDRRTAISSASECETDHSERRIHRKIKPNVTKGRGSKRIRSKCSKKEPRSSKSTLVTLRASQEEEDDAAEDFESEYEEENYHLAPEEVNKAPVFVPVGLRSPEPVTAQIEETMEELEITVNVPDVACIAVVEHQLSNTDVTTQELKQEENLNALSIEMTTGDNTQDETGANDGSTEAAIALLTMGDLVLQSEISTEQGNGACVLPDVLSKDKSHIPSSSDNVKDEIVHEYPEFSLPAISTTAASLEENKIVLEEQSTREKIDLMEKVKKNAPPTRNTTPEVTNNLRLRSGFSKPKPNPKKILGTSMLGAHQEVPSLFVTKEEEVEIQRETEINASRGTELEDNHLGSVVTAESKEQSKLTCVHDIKGTRISQERNVIKRNDDQEEGSQEVQILSVAPIVSSETGPHTLGSDRGLSEGTIEEPLRKDSSGDSVLTLHVPKCTPTSPPEVQQENVISPQDLTVNLVANVHQNREDEQAFILTLVEIPTNAVEEFTDTAAQLMPNSLLPAPILIKSVNTEESDMSMSFPVPSVAQNVMCLSDSGGDDSEKPPDNLDLISRKRFHCRLEEKNCVPPAKKSSLTSRDGCQEYTSEVCSKKLINALEKTGASYKGQDIFYTSGSTYTTPQPQKKQLKPTIQSIRTRSLDKIVATCAEKNAPQLPEEEVILSDKEERTGTASKSEQIDNSTSSSKTLLSRPGRRPLGFLSLICSKNSLESEESIQVHNKKHLKPPIPITRQNLKRSNPLTESEEKAPKSSDLLPSPGIVNIQTKNTGNSVTQASSNQPLLKEACKSGKNRWASEKEPTTVSEYFFGDIFIEVDEAE
ncbi:transcription factor TFIIIB component B'' homolog isoform X2 [Choloepus didactylus]|uniref:transcription factor TFIIIB component B'' homolog isoform X2 n=1 Tax=Choloepus didactylus TaxID=27675 RepID=UPI00189E2A76|nr:transcription factor TFIIIB component B'' homolog isoform X2 [Choloepus didactylus]